MFSVRALPAAVAATACVAGCGASGPHADAACLRAWNAPGNAHTRQLVSAGGTGWDVAVSNWSAAPVGGGTSGQGCGYLLSTKTRWLSVSGAWGRAGRMNWGVPPTQGGRRTSQQHFARPNARLASDGTLR